MSSKDEAEAWRWYRLAAGQGHAEAQGALGAMYALGVGVLKDSVLAHMWLQHRRCQRERSGQGTSRQTSKTT